ncbi:hypothetical protein J6590_012492 [Homalodisca vitripennis]|nr:hypothetical protein J6590_012492 [Homalodisca vitripennis]
MSECLGAPSEPFSPPPSPPEFHTSLPPRREVFIKISGNRTRDLSIRKPQVYPCTTVKASRRCGGGEGAWFHPPPPYLCGLWWWRGGLRISRRSFMLQIARFSPPLVVILVSPAEQASRQDVADTAADKLARRIVKEISAVTNKHDHFLIQNFYRIYLDLIKHFKNLRPSSGTDCSERRTSSINGILYPRHKCPNTRPSRPYLRLITPKRGSCTCSALDIPQSAVKRRICTIAEGVFVLLTPD